MGLEKSGFHEMHIIKIGGRVNNSLLIESYKAVLSSIRSTDFILGQDLYSGVFLSKPFEHYEASKKKVMVVGRETAGWNTAGWNTETKKNTISAIVKANEEGDLQDVIDESLFRYSWHLRDHPDGPVRTKSKSTFQRFYLKVAKSLELDPHALIYQNLYAWDFNGRSPLSRKDSEFKFIQRCSAELLAASIKYNRPDAIIFAVGCTTANDQTIKMVCKLLAGDNHGGGESTDLVDYKNYETKELVKRRYWHFQSDGIDCIRISHPRPQGGEFEKYRTKAINTLVEKFSSRS
ncbi:hypothetical protein [Idiomarina sp. HP20-50]|uniref:hypothetical protein n=1 Tax=Idiomarina sp. HP20-50 TaxID=3070813 RepID=UPI00294AEE4E|nr:hypothetical protein [Idiomarina sp. HP20-50]MDV6316460.1 hypothetical protein [Idiomarina sp. HP20-50]